MRVNVISLVRTPERRERFAAQNAHIDYQFVDAVDGAAMSAQALRDTGLFAPDLNYTAGAYGCALSHLAQWNQAIETGQAVTVAEDDAVFRYDFHAQHDALTAQTPPGWHIMVWGWNFDSVLSLNLMPGVSPAVVVCNQEQLRSSMKEFQALETSPALVALDKSFGSVAYTISPQGARRFRSLCFPMQAFDLYYPVLNDTLPNMGMDMAMNRAYALTDSRVCLPPLAATRNDNSGSTVQARTP